MSILAKYNAAMEAKDEAAMNEILHDDYKFTMHASGNVLGKADVIKWAMSGDIKRDKIRVIFENDEIGVEHAFVSFNDGNTEAVMAGFKYGFLILAVLLGVTSNSFAKSAEGFTLLFPSIITGITIVACMYALSIVMKNIPMGITYASFAGLTIIATVVVGIFRFDQMPNLYSIIGLVFIIIGVLMVNLLGNN